MGAISPAISDSGPSGDWIPVTPHDSAVLIAPRALFIGTGGNLILTGVTGDGMFKNIPNGTLLPMRPTKVKATGTTCTDILLIY